jgi:hypothetical protein
MDNITQIAGITGITTIAVAAIVYQMADASPIVAAGIGAIGGFLTGISAGSIKSEEKDEA